MWDCADSHTFGIYSVITAAHAKTAHNGVRNLVKQWAADGGGAYLPGKIHSCFLKAISSN